ncbi:gfo/Idh/MocA family oxidoreductase [Testudinibacter sp. TR-2022]|uniref:Gfo/Idh/MocA family oxidoreductase n=1 Tax=Testudinibacter sp. TR-2022 TaxID=2585029 RepID=UPI00111ADF81|nr:Gfo/Idh/MocA family oxidoreductase [Testudinibacter sp. TR-2022]TNH03691.1 gfo/Idh/MocA family oxidoreductase [Pasteurellaceae bacterium Phil31]TNH08049.1 gfo/Idh/MocA family oxidoreductase [Testudinibacter sp. TR-2022]TNH10261.1 gfo/Idh/MocA family oxidoreductase [Testudinibacter sp. TR-2022]TNH12144.1 gfo/Idh/MocA family oxidoreductase [Testudinibacter sp. TR-2022]TNH16093.1 gfo/Idh/MocA family oxidoreductase [Testudinibacter sp. TR-2022]
MKPIINVAIAGFGMSAQVFHVPFLLIDPRFNIKKVFERSSEKSKQKIPDVEVVRDFAELLTDEIDLVIITTPNLTHYPLAKQAIKAGKHIIVEKPVSVTTDEAIELGRLATEAGIVFSPYQNRRWDSGFQAVKNIIANNLIGDIVDYQVRYDRYSANKNPKAWKETGEKGIGLVYDLGVHLLDHAVDTFGMPQALFADIRYQHEGALSDDNFQIYLYYPQLKVELTASKYVREKAPHLALHGRHGSYLKQTMDIQESRLAQGIEPRGNWNLEDEADWGILNTDLNGIHFRGKIESPSMSYAAYYDNIYAAITANAPLIVTIAQATKVMTLLEKCFESAALRKVVTV